jgi:hypothetical protein
MWISLGKTIGVVETLKLKGQKGVIVDKLWTVFHRKKVGYPQVYLLESLIF